MADTPGAHHHQWEWGSVTCPPASDRLVSTVVFWLWLDASCRSGLFLTRAFSFFQDHSTTFPSERILSSEFYGHSAVEPACEETGLIAIFCSPFNSPFGALFVHLFLHVRLTKGLLYFLIGCFTSACGSWTAQTLTFTSLMSSWCMSSARETSRHLITAPTSLLWIIELCC